MGVSIQEMRDIVTFEWPRNPFPGLRPFREDEALIFYGRNSHKDEVLARLNNAQLVFVTGPSGQSIPVQFVLDATPAPAAGTGSAHNIYNLVFFTPQTANGTYTVNLGPNISDDSERSHFSWSA